MENPKTPSLFANTSKASLTTIPSKDIQIGELIGQGGYGSVYQGNWQYTTVAVKKLHLQKLTEVLLEEFKQEAAIMAQSQHPNIVRLWGVCLEPGHYSMVMEYMPKSSLYEVLHNPKDALPWLPVGWQIATDMSMGLAYLHGQGIIHRDIKSLNVLLDQHYHAKLADFGLARLKLETSSTSTQQGTKTAGTVRWKAPELFKRGAKADKASDVYSCGMVLWEIASRQLPYSDASDEVTVMGWIKDGEKENIPEDCPKAYAQIIQACWAEVKERPTASDIVKALKDATPKPEPKPTVSATTTAPRSWHYDVNNPKLPQEKVKTYTLVPATANDIEKVVQAYQVRPVKGHIIKNVQLIYNPDMNHIFAARLKLLQNRQGKDAFAPKWQQENQAHWRQQIHQQYLKLAQPHQDPDFPNVQLIPLWHGTKASVLTSLYETGYANLAKTDAGFFGKGLYFTAEAEYAHRVYSQDGLVLSWVASFSAYPIIYPDMKALMGQANYQNYDAHFVPVVPANPDHPNEITYYPCRQASDQAVYHEMVVFDSAQALPRYQVKLEPESVPLPPKPPLVLPPVTYQGTSEDIVKAATAMLRAKAWTSEQKAYFEAMIQTVSLPPVQTLQGHTSDVKTLALLPNGRLASGSSDGTIKLWDLNKGTCLRTLTGHTANVSTLVLLPNGWLTSGSLDKTIKLWDIDKGTCLRTLTGHTADVSTLVLLPNGWLASGSLDKTIKLWDLDQDSCLITLAGHTSWVTTLALLPDGRLVSGSWDKTIKLWDLDQDTCLRTLMGHTDRVTTLALLSNGRLASGAIDSTIKLWDLDKGTCLRTLTGHTDEITTLILLPNGQLASGSKDNTLKLWDLGKGICLMTLTGHTGPITRMHPLSNTHLISSTGGEIKSWRLDNGQCEHTYTGLTGGYCAAMLSLSSTEWIAASGHQVQRFSLAPPTQLRHSLSQPVQALTTSGHYTFFKAQAPQKLKRLPKTLTTTGQHTSGVLTLALLSNGRLASGSIDSTIKLWDIDKGACRRTLTGHTSSIIYTLALLPNGQLASGSGYPDNTLKLWDLDKGTYHMTLTAHTHEVTTLALLSDGRLASGSLDRTIKLWDLDTGICFRTLTGHTNRVTTLALLPNGQLASGSWDKTIKLWDLNKGTCFKTLTGHTNRVTTLALLPDGRLASGSWDKTIKLWDLDKGTCLMTLTGHTSDVNTLALLPNGRLASGSEDKTIKLWDLGQGGTCLSTLTGHTWSVTTLALLSDGRLASGSLDNTIKVCDYDLNLTLAELEQKAPECKMM